LSKNIWHIWLCLVFHTYLWPLLFLNKI
jgi:hypothetical protein